MMQASGATPSVSKQEPRPRAHRAAKAPADLKGRLNCLAGNLWWSWNAEAREIWEPVLALAPEKRRAELRRNPLALIASLRAASWKTLAGDRAFLRQLTRVEKKMKAALRPRRNAMDLSSRSPIAYFSMEYGLHESLPIYAGGLGLLAGDHLKSASDLGIPLVAIGLFYRQGYFRQGLDAKGKQQVIYPSVDVSTLPMEALRSGSRELRIRVELLDREVSLRVWKIGVGRISTYLLDADLPENRPADRKLTYRLYGGTREDRIRQEILAGIGGVRLLEHLGIQPGAWHLNEGHVVLLTLERLRQLRDAAKSEFDIEASLELIASNTVFTTHTPVPEGNEVFDLALADRYLRSYAEAAGIPVEDYMRMGLDTTSSGDKVLSFTVLAMRLSRFRNGVSALHGEVSRGMWSKLWPGFRAEEAPITSVTNGVHMPTWVASEFDDLYRQHVGENWVELLKDGGAWKAAKKIPDRDIWSAKQKLRSDLIEFVRNRVRERMISSGSSEAKARGAVENLLDPNALTIGFARRFALYKRATLLFRDLERAAAMFGSKNRPVQIIFAGKPHPEDSAGKKVFEEVYAISRKPAFRDRVVLLADYDIDVARRMVQGVDVWLNNPRRPLEASGTSGQKVPINAGLNCSILDGWWCEGYAEDTGFAFGKTKAYDDEDKQDQEDNAALLRCLEKQVIELFFRRDRRGLPRDWLKLVKSSMAKLIPQFSTHTMVSNYVEQLYLPAFENGQLARSRRSELSAELAAWHETVRRSWPLVELRGVSPGSRGRGKSMAIEVEAYFGGISPQDILCCGENAELVPIVSTHSTPEGACRFKIQVPAPGSYRLFPSHPDLVHPQETGCSLEFRVRRSRA